MSRINVSLKPDLVKEINELCGRNGKTVSSSIAEAISFYIKTEKTGLRLEDLEKAGQFIEFLKETDSVPVPSILLDAIIKIAMSSSEEETLKKWYDRGFVAGDIIKKYAEDITEISTMLKDYREVIPASLLEIEKEGSGIIITLSGAGNSLEASRCTLAGIDGFLKAFNFKTISSELSEGFVRIRAGPVG